MKNTLILLFSLMMFTDMLNAQSSTVLEAYEAAEFTGSSGTVLPYRVLWPAGYEKDGAQKYPLLLFLHGAGERGNDNALQLVHGSELFLQQQADYPAIVVMPQCAKDDYWAQMTQVGDQRYFSFAEIPNPSMGAVIELLEHFLAEEAIATDQVYLMGLSMGGMGTFELLARKPDTFAAAVPICGGTNPALLPIYADKVPLWIFHGEDDKVVLVEQSRRVVKRLEELGHSPRYTEYPGVNHNSWDNAFAEPDLLSWLFSHRKQ